MYNNCAIKYCAAMAQSVERILGKDEVTGSIPVSSSKNPTRFCEWDFYFFTITSSLLTIKTDTLNRASVFIVINHSRIFVVSAAVLFSLAVFLSTPIAPKIAKSEPSAKSTQKPDTKSAYSGSWKR